MASRKRSTGDARSIEVPARRKGGQDARDADFESLLRMACLKAAGVGALSALAGVIPGTGMLLRFALGEVADLAALSAIQEKLIEDTLALYDLPLPEKLRRPLIQQISTLGASASVSVDAMVRKLLGRYGGKIGGKVLGPVIGRIAPVAAVLTSALGNAATTYAIGRRAQAFAKLGEAPADNLSDAIRAFTGVDERRLWDWSVTATREALGRIGGVLGRVKLKGWRKGAAQAGEAPAEHDAASAGAEQESVAPAKKTAQRATKKKAAAKATPRPPRKKADAVAKKRVARGRARKADKTESPGGVSGQRRWVPACAGMTPFSIFRNATLSRIAACRET